MQQRDGEVTGHSLRLGAIVCIAVCVVFYGTAWIVWELVH